MRLPVVCLAALALIMTACAAPSSVRATATPTLTVAARPAPTPRLGQSATLGAAKVSAPLSVPQLNLLLDSILPEPNDVYGIVVEDLASGARAARNDSRVFPSASLYKLGVAWAVVRAVDAGALGLDTPVDIQDEDAIEVEPEGGVAPGETLTVRDALGAMIGVSSNAAAHALLRVVGRQNVNDEMARVGLAHTRVPEADEDAGQGAGTAVTDAADMALLLRLIVTSRDLSGSSRAELVRLLAEESVPDALRDDRPDGIDILDKTGNLEDASNVAALIQSPRGTIVLTVVDQGVDPGDARAVIARLGAYTFDLLRP